MEDCGGNFDPTVRSQRPGERSTRLPWRNASSRGLTTAGTAAQLGLWVKVGIKGAAAMNVERSGAPILDPRPENPIGSWIAGAEYIGRPRSIGQHEASTARSVDSTKRGVATTFRSSPLLASVSGMSLSIRYYTSIRCDLSIAGRIERDMHAARMRPAITLVRTAVETDPPYGT